MCVCVCVCVWLITPSADLADNNIYMYIVLYKVMILGWVDMIILDNFFRLGGFDYIK